MRVAALIGLGLLALSATTARAEGMGETPAWRIPPAQRSEQKIVFADGVQSIRLIVDKRFTRPAAPGPHEAEYQGYYSEAGVYMTYAADVRLSAKGPWYVLRCDSGPSDDPSCTLSLDQDPGKPAAASVAGTLFVIPGDGCIYAGGHSDTLYNKRALQCERDGGIVELPQPLSYVGLRSTALRDLALTSDRDGKQPLTTIPKGAFVEVVVEQDGAFLLRDGFGIAGWFTPSETSQQATDIDGFFYRGD